MAHHKRRPSRTLVPLLTLLAVAAPRISESAQASATDQTPFASNPTVVHGSEHLGWEEAVTDGSGGVGFRYFVYVDGKSMSAPDVKCQPNADGNLDCTAGLPSMTAGPHRLALSTIRLSPGPSESAQSAPIDVLVQPWNTLSTGRTTVTSSAAASGTTGLTAQTLISGLDGPSALAAAPDGRVFLVEKTGSVRVWQQGATAFPVAERISDSAQQNGGGQFGIAVDPDFANNHRVYVAYTREAPDGALENQIVRFREVNNSLGEAAVIFTDPVSTPPSSAPRIAFGPDGKLYPAFPGATASNAAYEGKVLRLNDDGSTPRENAGGSPIFAGREGDVLAFAWQPSTQRFWELYRDGHGELVLGAIAADTGAVIPVRLFAPTLYPSGIAFDGSALRAPFPGNLLVATQSGEQILYVTFDPGDPSAVTGVEQMLPGGFGRISALTVTPDGLLYFCTNNRGTGPGAPDDDRLILLTRRN